jgi:beta-lactamase superfamily II metal-dependent hydrolase
LEVTLALLLVASVSTASQVEATTPDRLTFLGSGTSWLLQSDGRTAIIDGSPHPLALLSALGDELGIHVRSIDLVMVTDPRSSNVAGLLSLLDHYHVRAVMDVGAEYPSRTYADWRRALQTSHIPVYGLRAGATARIGHVTVRALAPDATCYAPPNCAGILRLTLRHRKILLATHAGNSEQENVVFHGTSLRATDLVLGDLSHASLDFIHAADAHKMWCVAPPVVHHSSCTALTPGESENWPM